MNNTATKQKTEDPRFRVIKNMQCYALYHTNRGMIYIGWTWRSLGRRLQHHLAYADIHDTPLYNFLEECEDISITIEPLYGYDSEKEAIEDHSDRDLLNVEKGEAEPPEWRGHEWSTDELDFLRDNSIEDTMEYTGASYNQIQQAAKKLNYSNTSKRWVEREIKKLGTDTDKNVAEEIGRSPEAVYNKRRREGISAHRNNGRSLSHEQACNLYILYHSCDYTQGEIAGEYDVSQATCQNIVSKDAAAYDLDYGFLDDIVEVIESENIFSGFDRLNNNLDKVTRQRELLRSKILH